MKKKKIQKVEDGAYRNLVTGLNDPSADKTTHTRIDPMNAVQNDLDLAYMYVEDGLASSIASAFPEASLAEDIKIIGDEDGSAIKELESLDFIESVIEAATMSRVFGGAAILTLYDGHTEFEEMPDDSEKVVGYKVYSSADFELDITDFVTDVNSDYYNEVELFRLIKDDGTVQKIHTSRLTIFNNKKLPRILRNLSWKQRYFGCSSVKEVDDSLKQLGASLGGLGNMVGESGVKIFSLAGLQEMLANPDNGMKAVQERLNLTNLSISAFRTIFQDKDDTFEMVSHNFTGIPEVVRLMMIMACARSRIPMSILFGQTITGLSNTNDGDIKTYNSVIARWRKKFLYKNMCKMITDFYTRNRSVSGLQEFDFAPLGALSGKEYIDAKFIQAQTLEKFFNMGAITPEEIRKNALVNGGTFEISVDDGDSWQTEYAEQNETLKPNPIENTEEEEGSEE